MKNMSTYVVIGAVTAFVSFGCGGNSSSNPIEAAKDSNAAKIDSTRDATSKMASVPPSVSQTDQKFAVDAANAGMTEIEAAKTARQNGREADVKEYAAMIIKDHTEVADKLKAIAAKKNLTLPADISRESQEDIAALQKKTGKDFDKAYLKMMVADHKKALILFNDESKNGSDADIRAFADATVHTLQHHLDEAEKCEKMMGKM
ncbi:DUF4142 domain-containing protein [Puia dinghuensis]|uniref:DUF4142 domain-containing protein n=1 Tax=Puia dinghuensis TaxID=1792502 RepID=A0A8J2XSV5_9BACT|nr:DUF4142 domain-containing protein [Puia dinghuensis]GGA98958.1 hypothetical protein GCM10011511_22850 [Puia dinghuensis]